MGARLDGTKERERHGSVVRDTNGAIQIGYSSPDIPQVFRPNLIISMRGTDVRRLGLPYQLGDSLVVILRRSPMGCARYPVIDAPGGMRPPVRGYW